MVAGRAEAHARHAPPAMVAYRLEGHLLCVRAHRHAVVVVGGDNQQVALPATVLLDPRHDRRHGIVELDGLFDQTAKLRLPGAGAVVPFSAAGAGVRCPVGGTAFNHQEKALTGALLQELQRAAGHRRQVRHAVDLLHSRWCARVFTQHLQLARLLQGVGHARYTDQRPVGGHQALRQCNELGLAADQPPRPRWISGNGRARLKLLPILLRHPLPRVPAALGHRALRPVDAGSSIDAVAGAAGTHHKIHVALGQHLVGNLVIAVA
ncbi:hypothetical protein D3C73_825770 [compost metagenome]